jgi:hypothetical protein
MTKTDGSLKPEPWSPFLKLLWWIIAPLVLILQVASIFAERRPPADLEQRELGLESVLRTSG